MKNIWVIGVDLGKNSCSLVGLDAAGHVVLRRRVRRDGVVSLVLKLPICIVAMEECCGAHHLGRQLKERGSAVRHTVTCFKGQGSRVPVVLVKLDS
jgi:transposase